MYRHIQCAIITLITVDDDHDDWYLYDKDKKICCGRKLERRIPDIDCCSNEIYFKREKMCCSGHLYDQVPGGESSVNRRPPW